MYTLSMYHMATAPQPPLVGHTSRRKALRYDAPDELHAGDGDSFMSATNMSVGIFQQRERLLTSLTSSNARKKV